MSQYRVKTAITPRKTPSMYETATLPQLAVGYTFTSSVLQALTPTPPISGQIGPITWVQLPNMYWVPLVYKSVTYVEEIPQTGTKKFTLNVEGFVPFVGTLTPLS